MSTVKKSIFVYIILWIGNSICVSNAIDVNPTTQELCSILPNGVTILRPNSCTNWVRCPITPESNEYEEGSCVYGLYFDKNTQSCEFEEDVVCPYKSDTVQNRCVNRADGTYLPDDTSCSGYIFCKNNQEHHSNCPGDLVFNPHQSACVYKSDYACTLNTEAIVISPVCRSIGDNIKFADDNDCTKYNMCSNGQLNNYQCNDGYGFNYLTGACDTIDTTDCHPKAKLPEPAVTICGTDDQPLVGAIPDDNSCSGYYMCLRKLNGADHSPKYVKCSNGQFFDASTWSCRDRVNVHCTLDRCEGMGDKYVNVPGDCMAYAHCKNGVSTRRGVCPNGYYFDERTQGCTPQIINYIACSA